jgi:hypothetical protein
MDFMPMDTAVALLAGAEAAGLLAGAEADDEAGGAVALLLTEVELVVQPLAASATPAAHAAAAIQFLIMMLP